MEGVLKPSSPRETDGILRLVPSQEEKDLQSFGPPVISTISAFRCPECGCSCSLAAERARGPAAWEEHKHLENAGSRNTTCCRIPCDLANPNFNVIVCPLDLKILMAQHFFSHFCFLGSGKHFQPAELFPGSH